jgi:ABC-type Fe3+-hydroxamate transport system substrate-binding protein
VSLSPLASRFVAAIGAADVLVGVDEASSRVPGLEGLPVADLRGAARLAPDLVLVDAAPDPGDEAAQALADRGAEVREFAPHDLEDALVLARDLAERLVGAARASEFERRLTRPLAAIGGESFGQPRLRVVGVVSLDHLEVAGGHSFETDLIEIAGATSVTHADELPRLAVGAEQWLELRPDLILVITRRELAPEERAAALAVLPSDPLVSFFVIESEHFWLEDALEPARRLRTLIASASRGAGA